MTMGPALHIRPASPEDAPALAGIYGWHVLHGLGTFEETPPDAAEMAARLAAVMDAGLPWRVAEAGGHMVGYACARPYIARSGYRHTCEDSVFVAPEAQGAGVGRRLLAEIIALCSGPGGRRQMLALIGDSANTASIRLHTGLGFRPAGRLDSVGHKHGHWLDVVLMQRALGSA